MGSQIQEEKRQNFLEQERKQNLVSLLYSFGNKDFRRRGK